MRAPSFVAWFVLLLAGAAAAQAPENVRVAGTVEALAGNVLEVKTKDGEAVSVTLVDNATVYGVEKRTLGDIKPGDFVASGGVKAGDGQIRAVEVRIFPPSLRGVGEGQRPWSVKTDGVMTNATVGTVDRTPEGGTIHVTYKDGQSEYSVAPDVPVLAYVDADRTLLKPGAAVLVFAQKQADGTLTTSRVTAEKDGVKPPM
ncbi:MAG: hypothetical protein JO032_21135 [Alphaproteobacteria bacterium]|nr:hypothetical protein [Alphaproteobacteria bacterium]